MRPALTLDSPWGSLPVVKSAGANDANKAGHHTDLPACGTLGGSSSHGCQTTSCLYALGSKGRGGDSGITPKARPARQKEISAESV